MSENNDDSKLSGAFKRYSKGPLYTEKELETVVKILQAQGFEHVKDIPRLGARLYSRCDCDGRKNGSAILYLDEIGCSPTMSGTMIYENSEDCEPTTIWQFAKKYGPSVKKKIVNGFKKLFGQKP